MSERNRTLKILMKRHEPAFFAREGLFRHSDRVYRLIKAYLKNASSLRILDQGCGSGYEIVNLNGSLPGNEFLGIDISPIRCHEAKINLDREQVTNASFIAGDGTRLPFVSGSINIAISNQVVEHVDEQDSYVREAYRVLCDGGVYLLTTGNRLFPWEDHLSLPLISWLPKKAAVLLLRLRYADWRHDFYESVYPISCFTVERILRSAGFSRVNNASLLMLNREMIATIPPGRRRIILERTGWIFEQMSGLPLFGSAFTRMLRGIFPYVAFICVK